VVSDGYALVWSDEFDTDGRPDPSRWTYETGFVRNAELQWYQPDNAFVADGKLVIEARREQRPNPEFGRADVDDEFRWRRTIDYTSASVTTRGLHAWRFGRFEIRARIATEEGLWPALWLLGVEERWPAKGEIDLMEYYDASILANFAWASNAPGKAQWKSSKTPLERLTDDPAWARQFHVWAMEWSKDRINLYLDGQLLNSIDPSATRNPKGYAVTHPFLQPHYLIINLALGGQAGGSVAKTTFPSRVEVDYVRVFQRVEESE